MTAGTVSRWAVAALSLAGLALATYLSVEHVSGGIPACGVSSGCGDVTTSEYAVLMGLPVAFIGVAGYGALLLGTLAYLGMDSPPNVLSICAVGDCSYWRGVHSVPRLHAGLPYPRLLRILPGIRRDHDIGPRFDHLRYGQGEIRAAHRARLGGREIHEIPS